MSSDQCNLPEGIHDVNGIVDESGNTDFGPCCACEAPHSIAIIGIDRRAPDAKAGWVCATCGVFGGAQVTLCAKCLKDGTPVRFACRGYAKSGGRVPIEELTVPFRHILAKHPEVMARCAANN